jgi:AcrR family transcriptional regulator
MAKVGSTSPPDGGVRDPGFDVLTPSDRDRILQAMTECCAERGYADTTVEEVTERAGTPRETFESLFSGKEDCAVTALNKIAAEMLTAVSTAGGAGSSPIEQSLKGLSAILGLMANRPSYASLSYVEARQGGTQRMHDTYESSAHILAVMMERARDLAPERPSPPPGAPRASLGGAEAVIRREIAAGQFERLPKLLPDFIYGALVPFVGQAEALRISRLAPEPESH